MNVLMRNKGIHSDPKSLAISDPDVAGVEPTQKYTPVATESPKTALKRKNKNLRASHPAYIETFFGNSTKVCGFYPQKSTPEKTRLYT
jgi:hypothetical protein